MCHHAGTMHKVAWRHFHHAVYTRIHVYVSDHKKVSSGNLASGTLADTTPAHGPRLTENWWSDPQSELLDWQNPKTGPNLSADPRSTVFFKSANPLDLSPKSTIHSIYHRNPQSMSFLRPNPPIHPPDLFTPLWYRQAVHRLFKNWVEKCWCWSIGCLHSLPTHAAWGWSFLGGAGRVAPLGS